MFVMSEKKVDRKSDVLSHLKLAFERRKKLLVLGCSKLDEESDEQEEEEEENEGESEEEEDEEELIEEELPEGLTLLGLPFEIWVHEIFEFIGSTINILNLIRVCKSFYIVGAHAMKNRKIKSRFAVQRIFEKEPSEEFLLKLIEWGCFDVASSEFLVEMSLKHKYVKIFEKAIENEVDSVDSFAYDIMEMFSDLKLENRKFGNKIFDIYTSHRQFNVVNFLKNTSHDIMNQSFYKKTDRTYRNIHLHLQNVRDQREEDVSSEEEAKIIVEHTNFFQHFILVNKIWDDSAKSVKIMKKDEFKTYEYMYYHRIRDLKEGIEKKFRRCDILKSLILNEFHILVDLILQIYDLEMIEMDYVTEISCDEKALKCLLIFLNDPRFIQYYKEYYRCEMVAACLFYQSSSYFCSGRKDRFDPKDLQQVFQTMFSNDVFQKRLFMIKKFFSVVIKSDRSTSSYFSSNRLSSMNLNTIHPLILFWMEYLARKDVEMLNQYFQYLINFADRSSFLQLIVKDEGIIRDKIDFNYGDREALKTLIRRRNFEQANILLNSGLVTPNEHLIRMIVNNFGLYSQYRYARQMGLFFQTLVFHKDVDPSLDDNYLYKRALHIEREKKARAVFSNVLKKHKKVRELLEND